MAERRGIQEEHAAAAAAAVASLHPAAGRQLLQAQYTVSSWIDRHGHGAVALPPPLHHGPVELLQRVLTLTESPYASAKLRDDAVILLLYGASFLQDQYDGDTKRYARIEAFARQQDELREQWKRKAQEIQKAWRTQRFHTNRLPALSLDTLAFLQPQVTELMQRKTLCPQDSLKNLTAVPIQVNQQELETQVVTYAEELCKRVDARRRNEDEVQKKQIKDQRVQEERRKRMILQRKKRHERACRRWHYFTTRLLRVIREDTNESGRQMANPVSTFMRPQSPAVDSDNNNNTVDTSQDLLRPPHQYSVPRVLVRRFVSKVIARGVSRVLCTFNMGRGDMGSSSSTLPRLQEPAMTTADTDAVLRLGLLLCDLHFGIKYTGLYQRYFDRAAKSRGLRVEWHVFNCLRSQFPTNAHTRTLHGYLVAGGPNIGVTNSDPLQEEKDLGAARRRSISGTRGKNRHAGRWRDRLLVLLRNLHARKQILLGGMGLGHVLLAEALGARVGMKEWEDGWSVLEPAIFFNETGYMDPRHNQAIHGVRFLHGEFVQSFGTDKSSGRRDLKSWRSSGDHSFVACFRDPLTLSMDGSPECGGFVFETLGEFYDRDKAIRARQSRLPDSASSRMENQDNDDGDDFTPVSVDATPSLEENRKRLGITNASDRIADLFLDHFDRHDKTSPLSMGGTMAITGTVCSSGMIHVDKSLRHLLGLNRIGGAYLNVTASTDGHLMVMNPKAFALVVDHDKRTKDYSSKQRLPMGSSMGQHFPARRNSIHRPPVLTLSMLRDHDRDLRRAPSPSSGSSNQLSPSTIRLPSIQYDGSIHSLNNTVPTTTENQHRRLDRRTSTMTGTRLAQAVQGDGISVLTLSQSLRVIAVGTSQGPTHKVTQPKRVFLRVLDEECKQTHELLPLSKAELRIAWLRLTAAIRLADLHNDQIAIVSRHSLLLEYIKRRRPTWIYVKDCRRSEGTHEKRVKKVAQYIAYADIVLLDQDFLLSNSANENDVLLRKAKSFGLEVYVAPRNESPTDQVKNVSPKKIPSRLQNKSSSGGRSHRRMSLCQVINGHQHIQGDSAEYDMQVVEFMLLQFSGVDGVITCHPEAAVDALERIAAKNDATQQVEQLFRDWQAKDKDTAKALASPQRRTSSTAPLADPTLDDENLEDYVDSHYDSDDSIPEQEIVEEMERQRAEHFDKALPSANTTGGYSGGSVRNLTTLAGGPLTSTPFVPLRPLKPRSGDDVFGAGAIRRQFTTQSLMSSSSSGGGRLSSIGSFRAALKRTSTTAPPLDTSLPHGESKNDPRNEIRSAVGASQVAVPPLASARSLKPMSMRKILYAPR